MRNLDALLTSLVNIDRHSQKSLPTPRYKISVASCFGIAGWTDRQIRNLVA